MPASSYEKCSSDNTIQIKTGSSAIFAMVYTDDQLVPIDLTGYTIEMDFTDPKTGVLIIHVGIGSGVTVTDAAAGEYTIDAGSTINWPVGMMPVDILYGLGGVLQHTETFFLNIQAGLTKVALATPAP